MNFWIFENFLKIFGNLCKSSEIFGSFLKLFLSNFASFENFLKSTSGKPIRIRAYTVHGPNTHFDRPRVNQIAKSIIINVIRLYLI